tara:strand:- start:2421 stop:4967 length:2547 start_codon:yes stop_codon:yes gene_type:complete
MAISVIAGLALSAGAAISTSMVFFGIASLQLFALGAGLSMVSRALMPKPSAMTAANLSGITQTVREPASTRKIIYGRTRVGGAIVYMHTSGNDNEYLHLVVAIAGHEIDGYEEIYFNDEKVWANGNYVGSWSDLIYLGLYDGSQTVADNTLSAASSQWGGQHKLLDTAYIYARLKYDREDFGNGVPNISALIKGKKVYNPANSQTEWSQNPALIVNDYLLDTKYGLAEVSANINQAALSTAQSLCNQQVSLAAGAAHSRYVCDGVLDTDSSRQDNIESLLSSMGGKLIHSGGEYFITGAAYVTPTVVIDESVMVGAISIQTKQSRRSIYNGVKGVFLSEDDNYILADYPSFISQSYSLADGDPIYLDMPLPFTTNNIRAQRLAKLALLLSRQQTKITVPCNLAALKFKAGDTIMITNEKIGWSQKIFEVLDYTIEMTSDGQIVVNVDAIETAAALYDWNSSDEEDYLSGGEVSLYDGKTVAAPTSFSGAASFGVGLDGTIIPKITLTWVSSADVFVVRYDVQWSTDNTNWNSIDVDGNRFTISPTIGAATYYTRIRAVNNLGVRSLFVTANITAIGDNVAPSGVTSLSAVNGQGFVTLSWVNPTDRDFSNAEIYRSTTSSGTYSVVASVAGGFGLQTSFVNGSLSDSTQYFYKIKAVDYSGNRSTFSGIVSATTKPSPLAPRAANGYIFYQLAKVNAPSTPSATSYNYNTGSFGGLTANWANEQPVITGEDGKFWATSFLVTESTYDGAQTIAFSSPFETINFDGLITFTNLNNELSNPSSTQITTIDGGLVKTGVLDVSLVNISGTTQSGFNLQSSANTAASRMKITNDTLEIFQGSTLRVKLGNLA